MTGHHDHYQTVYDTEAERYEALVSREDAAGALLPALQALAPLRGVRVVEAGAGTGRLTRLIAPLATAIKAFDAAEAMLGTARATLACHSHVELAVADHTALPVPDGWADIALEGWAFGHAVAWCPEGWVALTDRYVDELLRVLRPGGTAILIETLGTGHTEPTPPNEGLAALYAHWEARGFHRTVLRTDYRFEHPDLARSLTQMFFRRDFDFETRADGSWLPECTGLWSLRKP